MTAEFPHSTLPHSPTPAHSLGPAGHPGADTRSTGTGPPARDPGAPAEESEARRGGPVDLHLSPAAAVAGTGVATGGAPPARTGPGAAGDPGGGPAADAGGAVGGTGGGRVTATRGGPVVPSRRLHPAYLLISGGRMARGLIPVIAVGVWRLPGWTFAICGLLVAACAVGAWTARRYAVAHGVLTVRSGVLRRSEHLIPVSRITSLDARQGLVQRAFRVWALRVETPGTAERSAVELACLSTHRLAELRAALQTGPGAPPGHPAPTPGAPAGAETDPDAGSQAGFAAGAGAGAATERPVTAPPGRGGGKVAPAGVALAALGRRDLLVATLTGVSAPLIFAGGAAAYGRIRELVPRATFRAWEASFFGGGSATALVLVGLAAVSLLAGFLLTAQRMARFTLTRDGGHLRTSRGLISQRVDTVVVDRVQAVRIVQGVLRRALGYCALEVEVAGHGRNDAQDRTLFPLVRADQAEQLVQAALPELRWRPGPLTPVPARSRRRYLSGPVAVGAATSAAALLLPGFWALLAIGPLPAAVWLGIVRGRVAGWRLDDDTVTLRSQMVVSRCTTVARVGRVQLTRLGSTPLQRRARLASIHLTLSSRRGVSVRHLDAADALLLLHRVGRRRTRVDVGSGPYGG